MRNRVVVRSLGKSFKTLEPKVAGVMRRLFLLKKVKNAYIEIYLTSRGGFNVHSFPAPKSFPRPDIKQKPLGEIYLNPEYIERHATRLAGARAKRAGDRRHELVYMLIHSFLHLLGYDHKKKSDRIIMEKEEQSLLKHLTSDN